MSYELYHSGKPVGQVASMFGMAELTERFADRQTELGAFLRSGASRSPAKLAEAIREELVDNELDEVIRETLKTLLRKLPEQGVVSISGE